MKFLLITVLAIVGCAAAAQLPDSATQGPNPQDIATPEPEYIDIDLPEPPRPAAAAPAPVLVQQRQFAQTIARPVIAAPVQQHIQYSAPRVQVPGHTFSRQSGYQYRRPVYVRRFYRLRRY